MCAMTSRYRSQSLYDDAHRYHDKMCSHSANGWRCHELVRAYKLKIIVSRFIQNGQEIQSHQIVCKRTHGITTTNVTKVIYLFFFFAFCFLLINYRQTLQAHSYVSNRIYSSYFKRTRDGEGKGEESEIKLTKNCLYVSSKYIGLLFITQQTVTAVNPPTFILYIVSIEPIQV